MEEDRIKIAEEKQRRYREQEKLDKIIVKDTKRFRSTVLHELRVIRERLGG